MLILTSSQNFSWFSMTEIIPEIEELWKEIAKENEYEVIKINVDEVSVKELVSKGIAVEFILVTCFNLKISWALKILRNKVELSVPLKFYVHGMATVGLWPLTFWEWDKFWRRDDSFLVSCKRDLEILKEDFPSINVELLPFTKKRASIDSSYKLNHERHSFYYVGRISEQKNIHSLIFAFSKHLETFPSSVLTLFGKEDTLGSPNMGIESTRYREYLNDLLTKLGLVDQVYFRGFVPREKIKSPIPEGKKTFISTSLHSDENFGMAALEALDLGHRAILSNWGGFADFKEHYTTQTRLIDVESGDFGPYVNMSQLVKEMNMTPLSEEKIDDSKYYLRSQVAKEYKLDFFASSSQICDFSLSNKYVKLRLSYSNDIRSSKIFANYNDENYHYFSKRYAFSSAISTLGTQKELLPWVMIDKEKVIVNDPHKGRVLPGIDWESSLENYQELLHLGYVFSDKD